MATLPRAPGTSANLLHPAPAPSFDDPLGMLVACHGRIRRQLATLDRLARHVTANGVDMEARAAAHAIVRYFDRAGADHHADEDVSLFPRLVRTAPDMTEITRRLGEEHRALGGLWRKLRPQLGSIAAGRYDALPPRLVIDVCEGYEAHLVREETLVIPRARDCLDAQMLAEIGREFAARRGQ